jgi:hypothetical protein
MALAGLDLSLHLFQNWVSFVEGQLGLSAELVRHGQWPHRDWNDVYSGGLALLDAGAQWLFGNDAIALRIPLGVATILWVAVLAACLRHFVSPPAAAGLALVGYLWGPPLYTAAMPSWYLLFFATGATWCLLKWNETMEPRWWGAAGVCIGLALFFKINALFLLAGAGCVLLTDDRHRGGLLGGTLVLLGVLGVVVIVGSGWWWPFAARLIVPLLLVAVVAIAHATRAQRTTPGGLRPMFSAGGWLALGVAVIVVPWFLAYALGGGFSRLLEGLFVLPFKRPASAAFLPQATRLVDLLPIAALPLLLGIRWPRAWGWFVAAAIVALTCYAVDAAGIHATVTVRFVWRVVRGWGMLAPLAVAAVRWWEPGPRARPILIVGWVAAWCALWQYPFAAPNYLAYVAPLLLLAGVAAASLRATRQVGVAVAASLALWTVAINHGQPLSLLGYTRATPPPPLAPLDVPHGGGLLIPAGDAWVMHETVDLLRRWRVRSIVAGPDAPAVYYFSDLPMPDREMYEFFAPEWSATVFAARIREHDPDALVLNVGASFSKIAYDSVPILVGKVALVDTTIGPFRMLLFKRPPAEP